MNFNITPRDTLQWYGVDLDNCIAEAIWPEPGIGEPIWENVQKMREVVEAGYKIMIHTSRYWGDYELIQAWLKHWNIDHLVKEIHCGKPLYHRYVDDKAINSETPTWLD